MRFIWLAILVSIALYIWTGEKMSGFTWLNFHNAGKTFVVLAFLDLLSFSLIRWKTYSPAFALVQEQTENGNAIRGWMTSWIILLCLAESEALFGLAFRMGDKTLAKSLPFYALGILLTLWLWPREFWPSAPSVTSTSSARWMVLIGLCSTAVGVLCYFQFHRHKLVSTSDFEFVFLEYASASALLLGLLSTIIGSCLWAWRAAIRDVALYGLGIFLIVPTVTQLIPINVDGWTGSFVLVEAAGMLIGILFLVFAAVRVLWLRWAKSR